MTLLCYESKVLSLIGSHTNIIPQVGVLVSDQNPMLVLGNVSNVSLSDYLKKNSFFPVAFLLNHFLTGLSNGLLHIHSKSILHNNLSISTIFMKSTTYFSVPVLTDFSFACRVSATKCFTIKQCDLLKGYHHLPKEVNSGKCPPSFQSDVYSYGVILSHICEKHRQCSCSVVRKLERTYKACLSKSNGNILRDIVQKMENNFFHEFPALSGL